MCTCCTSNIGKHSEKCYENEIKGGLILIKTVLLSKHTCTCMMALINYLYPKTVIKW